MSKNVIYLPKGEEKTVHPTIPPRPEPQNTTLGSKDGTGRLFELITMVTVLVIFIAVIVIFISGGVQ